MPGDALVLPAILDKRIALHGAQRVVVIPALDVRVVEAVHLITRGGGRPAHALVGPAHRDEPIALPLVRSIEVLAGPLVVKAIHRDTVCGPRRNGRNSQGKNDGSHGK